MSKEPNLWDETVGGAVSLIPFFGPVAGPVLARCSRRVRQEHQRNASVALRAAEDLTGRRREEIAEAVADDPYLVPLFIRVLYAAGINGHDATLRALGYAFGDAVLDRSRIAEADLILAALVDLGEPHIRMLRYLAVAASFTTAAQLAGLGPDAQPALPGGGLPESTGILALAGLLSRGLVEAASTAGGDGAYKITPVGQLIVQVLNQIPAGQA